MRLRRQMLRRLWLPRQQRQHQRRRPWLRLQPRLVMLRLTPLVLPLARMAVMQIVAAMPMLLMWRC